MYETWCMSCEEEKVNKIEEEEEDEKIKDRRKRNIKLYKHIGETSRSFYERALEHLRDLDELKLSSHMMKVKNGRNQNREGKRKNDQTGREEQRLRAGKQKMIGTGNKYSKKLHQH